MKKFTMGLILGIGLTATTAVFASDSIQASLFPTTLNFHVNGKLSSVDGVGDNGIINYNNRAYIPIRTFSENMGATVDYLSKSTTDPQKHQVDVYREDDQNFTINDSQGYVSLGSVQTSLSPSSNTATGIIKIIKPFDTTKKIRITVKTSDNSYESDYVLISNPENEPLKAGDIRSFTANLKTASYSPNPSTDIMSIDVITEDVAWTESQPDGPGGGILARTPFNVEFGSQYSPWIQQSSSGLKLKVGDPMRFLFQVQALIVKPIFLRSPLIFNMEITNIDTEQVVWNGNIPALPATQFPSWKKFETLDFFWNQTDNTGSPVPPGNYSARVIGPLIIQYSDTEQSTIQTESIDENRINRAVNGKGIEFTIEAN